jgi:cell division protein FtsQ
MNAAYIRAPYQLPEDQAVPVPLDIRLMKSLTSLMVLLLIAFSLAGLGWWLLRLQIFALAGITVTGDVKHTNMVTLKANVTPHLTGNFFTINLNQAREIFQKMPWIRTATVEREFPNRLHVHLEEHQPVAFWGEDGDERLINNFGEVFEPNVGELDETKLPRLSGPDNQAQQVLEMYKLLKPMAADIGIHLSSVQLSPRGSWRAVLSDRAVIELGRGQMADIISKFKGMLQTLPTAIARFNRTIKSLEHVDLRYENGYALRIKGVNSVEPAQGRK